MASSSPLRPEGQEENVAIKHHTLCICTSTSPTHHPAETRKDVHQTPVNNTAHIHLTNDNTTHEKQEARNKKQKMARKCDHDEPRWATEEKMRESSKLLPTTDYISSGSERTSKRQGDSSASIDQASERVFFVYYSYYSINQSIVQPSPLGAPSRRSISLSIRPAIRLFRHAARDMASRVRGRGEKSQQVEKAPPEKYPSSPTRVPFSFERESKGLYSRCNRARDRESGTCLLALTRPVHGQTGGG
ncbi:hypothetical protein IWX49DRAFT_554055 [Phyllosticta citricarpa]